MAEHRPIGGLVEAFGEDETLGKREFGVFDPILAAEAGSGMSDARDHREMDVLIVARKLYRLADFDKA